jgi:putative FmdB family regulatory protein
LPIYEYECTCCPSRFEVKRGFDEDSPVCCPSCGSRARRLFSPVSVIFKGAGFYATDSRGSQSYPSEESRSKETKTESTKEKKEKKEKKEEKSSQ